MRVTVKNVLILNLISSTCVAQYILLMRYQTEATLVICLAVAFAVFNILMTKVSKVYGFEFDVDDGKLIVDAEKGRRSRKDPAENKELMNYGEQQEKTE